MPLLLTNLLLHISSVVTVPSDLTDLVTPFFAPLVGQPTAITLLSQAIQRDRVAPGYLFAGADGVGRALAARCFIQALFAQSSIADKALGLRQRLHQGNHPDVLWVAPTYQHQGKLLTVAEAEAQGISRRSAPIIRLEQIRQITQFLSRPPLEADRSVVVLENAETMAESAANALLKTLEEPGQATVILIAPSADSILPTLVSRCQRIPFQRLDLDAMTQVLTQTGHHHILSYPELLAMAQGSPGAAITALHQYQVIPPELLQATVELPTSLRSALELARQITKTLDLDQQLWLISYLQHRHWQTMQLTANFSSCWLHHLETARKQLLSYAQPRLVWEVALMALL